MRSFTESVAIAETHNQPTWIPPRRKTFDSPVRAQLRLLFTLVRADGGVEGSQDEPEEQALGDPRGDHGRLSLEVEEGAVQQQREGPPERGLLDLDCQRQLPDQPPKSNQSLTSGRLSPSLRLSSPVHLLGERACKRFPSRRTSDAALVPASSKGSAGWEARNASNALTSCETRALVSLSTASFRSCPVEQQDTVGHTLEPTRYSKPWENSHRRSRCPR